MDAKGDWTSMNPLINDLQLLAHMAATMVAAGQRPQDAVDKAEEVLFAVVERQQRHSLRHIAAPDKECFHCNCIQLAREADTVRKLSLQ